MTITDDDLKRFHSMAKAYAEGADKLLIHPDNVLLLVEELIEMRAKCSAASDAGKPLPSCLNRSEDKSLAAEPRRIPDADCFRKNDRWENSVGTPFIVMHVAVGGDAHLVNMKTGRTHRRAWDAVGAHSGRPWVRISWGGKYP